MVHETFVIFGLLLASIFAAVSGGCSDSINDRDVVTLPLAEVRRLSDKEGDKVMLLDARLPSAYQAGHIPGAINVPKAGIEADKEKLAPELAAPKYVIVYGENPGDGYALGITKRLLRAGQKGARLFRGGIAEWTSAGLRLEPAAGSGGGSK